MDRKDLFLKSLLPGENNDEISCNPKENIFWALFANFKEKMNFLNIHLCHFFLLLNFYPSAKRSFEKNWLRTDRQAWIHRTSSPRGPTILRRLAWGFQDIFIIALKNTKVPFQLAASKARTTQYHSKSFCIQIQKHLTVVG